CWGIPPLTWPRHLRGPLLGGGRHGRGLCVLAQQTRKNEAGSRLCRIVPSSRRRRFRISLGCAIIGHRSATRPWPSTIREGSKLIVVIPRMRNGHSTSQIRMIRVSLVVFSAVCRKVSSNRMSSPSRHRWVYRNIVRESATRNVEGERIGVFNRVFGRVYKVRLMGRHMKAWNTEVYYVVKHALIGSLLGGILATAFLD